MRRKTLIVVMTIVLCSGASFGVLASGPYPVCSVQTEWKRYTVRDEEFSVLLPELPAMTTSEETIAIDTRRRIRLLGAYANDVAYSIYTFENPLNQSLDDFIKTSGFLAREDYQIGSAREISLNEFHGKEFVVITPTSEDLLQFWKTDKHLYLFQSTSPKDTAISTKEFFSSLLFGPRQPGQEVTDGLGLQFDDGNVTHPGLNVPKVTIAPDGSPLFVARDVDRKPIIGSKPEPQYTEDARRHKVTGTVVLRVVFGSNGRVTNIQIMVGLPRGLTERAIDAARQIRFIPAVKDQKHVSTWMQLEYNFNLY